MFIYNRLIVFIFAFVVIFSSVGYSNFEYEWIADDTHKGHESYTPVEPLHVDILGQDIHVSDSGSALVLQRTYNVYLTSDWTNDEAYLLLNAFSQLYPKDTRFQSEWKNSLWIKVPFNLDNNLAIQESVDSLSVVVTKSVINDSDTQIAKIDGIKGKLFTKGLHKVVLRYLYHIKGKYILENILLDRFGIEVRPWRINYEDLTRYTTHENDERFESFKDEELIYLINVLEEVPSGMIKTPGLEYIIRRKDGLDHPGNPNASAIAWPTQRYIEFMSKAFHKTDTQYIYRLILHEKSHFLWEHLFDEQLKQDWIELGGWFENPDDINGWSTTDETRFVSNYAHNVNPNEDMAESISFYIINPDKLRTNAPDKYDFIQNRIMHGTRYISKIREDLTFRVYNLYPDYTYPARVKRIQIKITGKPEEDKHVFVEIEIDSEDGLDNASTAYIRMHNMHHGDDVYYQDLAWFKPYENGRILRYETVMSKYKASGYWVCSWLSVNDSNGNNRITEPPNIGWKFYLNNPLEDLEPPKYVEGSCQISIDSITKTDEGNIYNIKVIWQATDNNADQGLGIRCRISDPHPDKYYLGKHGKYDIETQTATVIIPLHDYHTNGDWKLADILMSDIANNDTVIYEDQLKLSVFVDTQNPDTTPPVLDVDNIAIEATPTNPDNPNGETKLKIIFYVKEKLSGFGWAGINLRDSLGRTHRYGFYSYSLISDGIYKSDKYIKCTANILLPVGSVPGIWGISYMKISDQVDNQSKYDFTTLVRFEVDDGVAMAPSFMKTKLLSNYPNPCNPETWIPYELSKLSDVTITIYDITGSSVRKLDLGVKNAGSYTNRDQSAYWDGKNELGENVSSGVYFYELRANDYVATRKLIIRK